MNETPPPSAESDDETPATDDPSTDVPSTDVPSTDVPPADAPPADDVPPTESLSDPESLRERDDVPFREETSVHDDEDHCSVGIEGRAVVGVTNDDGEVLLTVNEAIPVALLPHEPVESGDDWAAAARRAVEGVTDLTVRLDGVELVRDLDHFVEGNDEIHTTTHNVVFRASPVETGADDFGFPDDCDWSADWFDEFPEDRTDDVGGPVEDDVRLFVD